MFIGGEVIVPASFETACASLAELARGGWLAGASGDANAELGRGLARVGPAGAVPGLSRLVEVRSLGLTVRGAVAVMPLRWEAAGHASGMFPVLDANIALSRYGQSQTLLALTGAYRPPLGPLGAALDRAALRKVATATIGKFLTTLGDALADSARAAAPGQDTSQDQTPLLPGTVPGN